MTAPCAATRATARIGGSYGANRHHHGSVLDELPSRCSADGYRRHPAQRCEARLDDESNVVMPCYCPYWRKPSGRQPKPGQPSGLGPTDC